MADGVRSLNPYALETTTKTIQDLRQHIARIKSIQKIAFSALHNLNASQRARDADVRQKHNISGRFLRLTFNSEQRAKSGLSLLLGEKRTTGTVQMFGDNVEVQLCVCEVDPRNGNEKCLCSATRLQADLVQLESAFEGLAVENSDTVIKEGARDEGIEPEKKLDGIVEAMEKWGAYPRRGPSSSRHSCGKHMFETYP